jgi:hypothetical protein
VRLTGKLRWTALLAVLLLAMACDHDDKNKNSSPCDDRDGDGTCDVDDGCPDDGDKWEPGACGCGVAETPDGDGDGVADCIDGCPADREKTAPGLCGCGEPDTDTDLDGTPDCLDACRNDPEKTAPGLCGCDVAENDTDLDGEPDCLDGCPGDSRKTVPGVCGCGVEDVDTDRDGTLDCLDACPADAAKTAPGACGCGVADDDLDDDGVLDCVDNCPTVANPDQANTDRPGAHPLPFAPETPGGEVVDLGPRGDAEFGVPIGFDVEVGGVAVNRAMVFPRGGLAIEGEDEALYISAPYPLRSPWWDPEDEVRGTVSYETRGEPGSRRLVVDWNVEVYGGQVVTQVVLHEGTRAIEIHTTRADLGFYERGLVWVSDDWERVAAVATEWQRSYSLDRNSIAIAWTDAEGDACDLCPDHAGPATDADGDGIPDVCDLCPTVADPDQEDSDEDGVPDACDNCPEEWNPEQVDTDGDGFGDACEECPEDPEKQVEGLCGCHIPDTDVDGDGVICDDGCPYDAAKVEPGLCGCGVADDPADDDGDGVPNCVDGCPADPSKTEPLQCGCGEAETDTDDDGTSDCVDLCPNDPDKDEPGQCGCGVWDQDSDWDDVADCLDGCPQDGYKLEPGVCGCGMPDDLDSDGDGVIDCLDECPGDPLQTTAGVCGCYLPPDPTDTDGDGVADCVDNCPAVANPDQENGDQPWATAIPFAPEPAGANVLALDDDEISAPIPLGFPFTFFGETVHLMYVFDNGLISFAPSANSGCCSGGYLPDRRSPNGIIAVAWSDLYTPDGRVSWELRGSAPTRRMVVTWDVPVCCSDSNPRVIAQAILYEEGSRIEIHTTAQPEDESFTRGVENADGTVAVYLPGDVRREDSLGSNSAAYYTGDPEGDMCDACPATVPCP